MLEHTLQYLVTTSKHIWFLTSVNLHTIIDHSLYNNTTTHYQFILGGYFLAPYCKYAITSDHITFKRTMEILFAWEGYTMELKKGCSKSQPTS